MGPLSPPSVVLDEVQYYNGQMVQLYGDCTDVDAVRGAMTGSGYRPMMLKRTSASSSESWSRTGREA